MTCATCGKEGCHPNFHKTILQVIDECGPMASVRVFTHALLHARSASVADETRLAADRFVYGWSVEDQEGRRVDPTRLLLCDDGTYRLRPLPDFVAEFDAQVVGVRKMTTQLGIWDQMSANGQKDHDAVMDRVVLQYVDAISAGMSVDTAMHMEFVKDAMSKQLGIPREMLGESAEWPTEHSSASVRRDVFTQATAAARTFAVFDICRYLPDEAHLDGYDADDPVAFEVGQVIREIKEWWSGHVEAARAARRGEWVTVRVRLEPALSAHALQRAYIQHGMAGFFSAVTDPRAPLWFTGDDAGEED